MNRKTIETTPFGSVAIIWTPAYETPKIVRILHSKPGASAEQQASELYPNLPVSSCAEIDTVAAEINRFLEGEHVGFSLDIVDLSLCSEFQQRVLRAEHAIPRGYISTYRNIARHLGGNGARAVGNALARNPFPFIIPCHRTIRSDFSLGGFQGGLQMKRTLLEMEGIRFNESERVESAGLYYDT